jgi:signal transduction histidine kinase
MKRLPLKAKVSLGAALVTAATVLAAGLATRPIIFQLQLNELDTLLAENAAQLFQGLENFRGAPSDFRKPVAERFVPVSLRGRYLEIEGPEGQVLYRSANLRGTELTGEPGVLRTVSLFGRQTRIGTFRHGYLTLHMGTRLGTLEDMQAQLLGILLWIVPVSAGGGFLATWLLAHWAMRPVVQLTKAAQRIDAEHPDERLPMPLANDEIARLTEVLNRSFDRLQKAYQAAARFSSDASHQLKTPLAVLRTALEERRGRPETGLAEREEINQLLGQTRRLSGLVEDLLVLAQADAGRLQLETKSLVLPLALAPQLDDLDALCATRGLGLHQRWEDNMVGWGDGRRLAVIFQNLAENAVKYSVAGGDVTVDGRRSGEQVVVSVSNGGRPIPEEMRERIFERFHRGGRGEDVAGHGLGLNLARELARAQGGDVWLVYSDERGTCFALGLPAAAAPLDTSV